MFRNIFLVFLIITFFGCVTITSHKERGKLLEKNIRVWENFRLEGIVEINYKNLQFRNNIIIINSPEEFKMDVFKNGIFGLSGKKILKIRLSDDENISAGLINIESSKLNTLKQFLDFKEIVLANKSEILEKRKTVVEGNQLFFDEFYQIEKIINRDGEVHFTYNSTSLSKIEVTIKNKVVAIIYIDSFF